MNFSALAALDYEITLLFTTLAKSSPALILVTKFFATYAIFIIVGFAALSFFINWPFIRVSGKLLFIEFLISGVSAWVLNQFISLFFYRIRPFAAYEGKIIPLIRETFLEKSFPSDHAAVAMALAAILLLWSPKAGIPLVILALAIAFARVFAGVHYPTDVLAGIIVGGSVAFFVHRIFS